MNTLTYPPPSSPWQHFEFKSTIATALAVSVLTTILSYQLAALLTDLILGCKPPHVARIRSFHALLLSRRSSPLAICNALLRCDALTRLYFRSRLTANAAGLRHGEAISRDKARVKVLTGCLLVMLLVTPPVVNMLAVALTVESERVMSFREAGLDSLGFGVELNGSKWRMEPVTEDCKGIVIDGLAIDEVTAEVVVCGERRGPYRRTDGLGRGGLELFVVNNQSRVSLLVSIGSRWWGMIYTGLLKTGQNENLILKVKAASEKGKVVVKKGMKKILEVCQSSETLEDTKDMNDTSFDAGEGVEFLAGRKSVPCIVRPENEEEGAMNVFKEVDRFVTIVGTKEMIAMPVSLDEKFFDAGDTEFLRRRSRIAGMGILAIMAGVAIVARAIVGLVANNDVNDGIERMIKERVGLEYCDSSLSGAVRNIVLRYNAQKFDLMI